MSLRSTCLAALLASASALGAQQAPPPTLQQQVDELKASQQKMQKDLEEIKALLMEGSGRVEVPSRR